MINPLRLLLVMWLSVAAAMAAWKTGDKLEIKWSGQWYPGVVLEVDGPKTKIRYDGYTEAWDEWVTAERLQVVGAKDAVVAATTEPAKTPAAKVDATYAWPERPADGKAGLQGAWLRVETFYWNGSMSLNNQGWFFTKDGRFSKAPKGGFDFKAFSAAEQANKTDGVYWITGDKITLKWANGSKPTEYTFARKGDEIVLGGLGGVPVKGFKRGWRLDGEYEGGASFGGGAVANSNTLVFRKDGTFARSSIGSIRSTGEGTTVSAGSQSEAAGAYEFDGYTLTLTYADGTVKAHTVFAFSDEDGEGRPEYIYRDGTMMRNQESKRTAK
ncbi:MAG TPA: hypothetical protein VK968_06570 [Roseimicrobium sp.]|nr:hypothetical protein [Roseimicrobium sp.]